MAKSEQSLDDVGSVSTLGAQLSERDEQRHIGILYRSPQTGEVRFLDLAWHFRMRDSAARQGGLVIPSGLDETNARLMAAYCRLVVEANDRGEIPYGIAYEGSGFDSRTGIWLFGPDGDGLTCATFVIALFEAQGLPILVRSEWPGRETDQEWQDQILALLSNAPEVEPEYVERQREKIGAARFRPEEVAAGVESTDPPLTFEAAERRGKELVAELRDGST